MRETEKIAVLNIELHTPPSSTRTQKSLFATLQLSSQKKKKSNYSYVEKILEGTCPHLPLPHQLRLCLKVDLNLSPHQLNAQFLFVQ
jgi:hypothetical protein